MQDRVTEQIFLDPLRNKTGDVWHVFLKGNFENMLYSYKFDGKFSPEEGHYYESSRMLLDPYAKVSSWYRGICLKLVFRVLFGILLLLPFALEQDISLLPQSRSYSFIYLCHESILIFISCFVGSYSQRGVWYFGT